MTGQDAAKRAAITAWMTKWQDHCEDLDPEEDPDWSIAEFVDAAVAEACEAQLESSLVSGCIRVVAEINRRYGATSYADALETIERVVAEAVKERDAEIARLKAALSFYGEPAQAAEVAAMFLPRGPSHALLTERIKAAVAEARREERAELAWYVECAQALKRYTEAKPPQVAAVTAVITELILRRPPAGATGGQRIEHSDECSGRHETGQGGRCLDTDGRRL